MCALASLLSLSRLLSGHPALPRTSRSQAPCDVGSVCASPNPTELCYDPDMPGTCPVEYACGISTGGRGTCREPFPDVLNPLPQSIGVWFDRKCRDKGVEIYACPPMAVSHQWEPAWHTGPPCCSACCQMVHASPKWAEIPGITASSESRLDH